MKVRKINKNSRWIILVFVIWLCFTFSTQSQVTIGRQSPPLKGALLDLKEADSNDANSIRGMMLARVSLESITGLSPMLTGSEPNYETLKAKYTGLIVYNVNSIPLLEKGFCIWNGTRWDRMPDFPVESIKAKNGLSALDSNSDTVRLGGDLEKHTFINLMDSNLIFTRNLGKMGIGTDNPQAILHIENPTAIDPFILQNVNFVSDENLIDDPNPMYYNLRISENGTLRKSIPVVSVHDNSSFVYNLKGTSRESLPYFTEIRDAFVDLKWTKNGVEYSDFRLPEDGTYAFSFRLYGNTRSINTSSTNPSSGPFCLSAYKNGEHFYTKDFVLYLMGTEISTTNPSGGYSVATYTVNITVTGMAGDRVGFKMKKTAAGGISRWRLYEGDEKAANRTSMFYWRL